MEKKWITQNSKKIYDLEGKALKKLIVFHAILIIATILTMKYLDGYIKYYVISMIYGNYVFVTIACYVFYIEDVIEGIDVGGKAINIFPLGYFFYWNEIN